MGIARIAWGDTHPCLGHCDWTFCARILPSPPAALFTLHSCVQSASVVREWVPNDAWARTQYAKIDCGERRGTPLPRLVASDSTVVLERIVKVQGMTRLYLVCPVARVLEARNGGTEGIARR